MNRTKNNLSLGNRLWPRSLHAQLALLSGLMLAITIALYGWYTAREQSAIAEKTILMEIHTLAQNLATASADYLVVRDFASLEQILIQSAEFPGVLSIQVTDAGGRRVGDVVRTENNAPARVRFGEPPLTPPALSDSGGSIVQREADRLAVWRPVASGGILGWVRIEHSLRTIGEIRGQIRKSSLIAVVLAILASTALLLAFLGRPMRAIRRATVFAQKLDELRGNKIPVDRTTVEIEQLGEALNEASARLLDSESRLNHLAHHDPLTNLPNRLLFIDRLHQAISQAQRLKNPVALLFLDLDRFKVINDTLGHTIGDQLLKEAGHRLSVIVRDGDTFARLGGDEFNIILTYMSHAQDAATVAKKLLDLLSQPFVVEGHELFITASIGITLFPTDGAEAQTLLKNADAAMYRAKEQGGNQYQFYSPIMTIKAHERLAMETGLRHALERAEFAMYYQPQVDLRTGEIVGMEALIRWLHPTWGIISPTDFIPLAEQTGMIVPIGEWVLRTACAQNKAWQSAGFPPMKMGVNLSSRQLREKDLVKMVDRVLGETGLEPRFLELELTESLIIPNAEPTIETLRDIRAMGVQIAIDDFGTGHSYLNYLKHFPVDKLKIDTSFIRNIATDPSDAAIASAIILLAHNLGLKVIAEGVETEEQMAFLRRNRCDQIQGCFFSPAVPGEAMTQFLREGRPFFPHIADSHLG
ncbi:MAG: hypothetical protein A2V83_09510 [Nitrospirae bacterium RBG_16_64_22]|nr:MAG: hypothetical protein A2V83_09510 [Nitrospirae bacterium RBG_16_64_22]